MTTIDSTINARRHHAMTLIHCTRSNREATRMLNLVSRQLGNGGKSCFEVEKIEGSQDSPAYDFPPIATYWELRFLPAKYAELHPGQFPPNVDVMSGWVRGYLVAEKTAKRRRSKGVF